MNKQFHCIGAATSDHSYIRILLSNLVYYLLIDLARLVMVCISSLIVYLCGLQPLVKYHLPSITVFLDKILIS